MQPEATIAGMTVHSEESDSDVRADVWLWAARFFKTRSLARQAIEAGKVQLNGAPCKPSRSLHVGDRLDVTRGDERMQVELLMLSSRRGAATVAQTLYRETADSAAARLAARELRRLIGRTAPAHCPDKRARQQLLRMKKLP